MINGIAFNHSILVRKIIYYHKIRNRPQVTAIPPILPYILYFLFSFDRPRELLASFLATTSMVAAGDDEPKLCALSLESSLDVHHFDRCITYLLEPYRVVRRHDGIDYAGFAEPSIRSGETPPFELCFTP